LIPGLGVQQWFMIFGFMEAGWGLKGAGFVCELRDWGKVRGTYFALT